MKTMITSNDYNTLKNDALKTITMIRDCERSIGRIRSQAENLGLSIERKDGEDEMSYLASLAHEANERELSRKADEARANIEARINGKRPTTNEPSSFLGRSLNALANRLG